MVSKEELRKLDKEELVDLVYNLSISEGTVFNLLNKAANMVLPIYEGVKEEISKASVVGGDETGVKVGKSKFWAWTWQTLLATYIVISKSRGFITVENAFPEGFESGLSVPAAALPHFHFSRMSLSIFRNSK
ncbi:MAG: transposase [Mangrovibacterium sp.]|nr:transposase [Mangrovibacterium sp.]